MNGLQQLEIRDYLVTQIEKYKAAGNWKLLEELLLLEKPAPGRIISLIVERKGYNFYLSGILQIIKKQILPYIYYESIFRERKQPKPKKVEKRRGHNDKGSLRSDCIVNFGQDIDNRYRVPELPPISKEWYYQVYPGRENNLPLALASLPTEVVKRESLLRKQSRNRIQRKKAKIRNQAKKLGSSETELDLQIEEMKKKEKKLLDSKLFELYAQAARDRKLLFPDS
jgi:hypothetical protein